MGPREQAVRDYFGAVLSGKVNACLKIKAVAARIVEELDATGPGSPWHFDEERAQRHVGFIERFCRLPSGRLGQPFCLEPFQDAILSVVFGMVGPDGLRKYTEVLLVMGRKNGKTALCAAIELDLMVNDDEGAPEVYSVATSKDQSNKGVEDALRMVRTSPALRRHVRKRTGDLYCHLNMGVLKSLAANTNHLDGLDISGAVIDELAAMRNRDLYDLTIQGTQARQQPLVFEITTNGFVRNGIFDDQYAYAEKWLDGRLAPDDEKASTFLPFIYELDDRDEWKDEDCWIKANPGLGPIKSIKSLRQNVAKAKNDPSFLPTVMVKDFNLVENQSTAWLGWQEIHCPKTFNAFDGSFTYAVAGVDASDTTDITGACVLMKRPGDPDIYALHMGWIPETALEMAEREGRRGGRDGVPYDAWISRGLLRVSPTPIIDKRLVLDWFTELREEHGIYVYACGYDPWHMQDGPTLDAYRSFFGERNHRVVRQGPQTLSGPMKELKALYRENRIVDNANPVAEWCRSNVMARVDVNGNLAPDKKNGDPRNRIDLWAAELDAYVVLRDEAENYQALIGG